MKNEHIDKSKFEFVQQEVKIHDKKFDSEPIGYFKDAKIRFFKKKSNRIALIILLLLAILSILIPIVTTKNYTKQNPHLSYLPPRVPILEKLGILDGTTKYEQILIDESTIGSDKAIELAADKSQKDIALPVEYNPDFIVKGSLRNNILECSNFRELCKGGQNLLRLRGTHESMVIIASKLSDDSEIGVYHKYEKIEYTFFGFGFKPTITIDVQDVIGDETELRVRLATSLPTEEEKTNHEKRIGDISDYHVIATITEPGEHVIDVMEGMSEHLNGLNMFSSLLLIEVYNPSKTGEVSIDSVTVDESNYSDEKSYSGYELAQFDKLVFPSGLYIRDNGLVVYASFKYQTYEAIFSEKNKTMTKAEYDQIIADNPDTCIENNKPEPPYNPNTPGWTLSEGCPIKEVKGIVGFVTKDDGTIFYSIDAILDYKIYEGYDGTPYFFFGTDKVGHDYFALVWLGLRTSLFLALIISVINIITGVIYGAIAGYYGGKVDLIMERIAEIIGRIPFLVWLAIFLMLVGRGVLMLFVFLTFTNWLEIAGITRTQFYRYKKREYVLASHSLGAKDSRIIFRHILPNGLGPIITASILMIPKIIFIEATVSYLNFGVGYGYDFNLFGLVEFTGVSIGALLAGARKQLALKPYIFIAPVLILSVLMITFNVIGNGLRDAFNPALRGSDKLPQEKNKLRHKFRRPNATGLRK